MTEALFPLTAEPLPDLNATRKESAGASLTRRQGEAIAAGFHPLLLMVFGPLTLAQLHPDAKREYLKGQRSAPFTCGSCRFRLVLGWRSRSYGKCAYDVLRDDGPCRTLDASPRASHSSTSDVRSGWPACKDYQTGANDLSPDASRVIP